MKKREEAVYRERIGDGKENSEPPKKKKKAEKTGRKRLFLGKRKKKEEEIQKSQRKRSVSFIPYTLYMLFFCSATHSACSKFIFVCMYRPKKVMYS